MSTQRGRPKFFWACKQPDSARASAPDPTRKPGEAHTGKPCGVASASQPLNLLPLWAYCDKCGVSASGT